jgi:hypothetical protein
VGGGGGWPRTPDNDDKRSNIHDIYWRWVHTPELPYLAIPNQPHLYKTFKCEIEGLGRSHEAHPQWLT